MEDNKEKVATYDENLHTFKTIEAKKVYLDDDYYFFKQPWYKRLLNKILMFLVMIFSQPFARFALGYRLKGKKNLKGIKGAIIVANHIHPIDAFVLCSAFYPKKIFQTMLQTNLGLPGGKILRSLGGIPIPDRRNLLDRFMKELVWAIEKRGKKVVVYPEAALVPYSNSIREFKKGAFRFATLADAPIVPMVWTYHKPKGLLKLFKKKPCLHLTVLKPYNIERCEKKHETIDKALNEVHEIMNKHFQENCETFYTNSHE